MVAFNSSAPARSSRLVRAFTPNPVAAVLRAQRRNPAWPCASRVAGPALLLGALALMPAVPAHATPRGFDTTVIPIGPSLTNSVFAVDLDGDGDMDVLSAKTYQIFSPLGAVIDGSIDWYENNGAAMPGFTLRTISTSARAKSVYAADVDGDGDVDVLSASALDNEIAWYESDGSPVPSFLPRTIVTTADGARWVHAADLDRDGDLDVLSASEGDFPLVWYENDGARDPAFQRRYVSGPITGSATSVFASDLDGDGDTDVLSASNYDGGSINWSENDGTLTPEFTERTIDGFVPDPTSVFAIDLDGDHDLDVLSSSFFENKIAWYQNDGEADPEFTERTISTEADGAFRVLAADLDGDGDGDVDVLSASTGDNEIAWYENNGKSTPGFTKHRVGASDGATAHAADLDGDGDVDVLSSRTTGSVFDRVGEIIAYYNRPADTTPDTFRFTDQNNVAPKSKRTSKPVTITGIEAPVQVKVSGGSFSIGCTGVFVKETTQTPLFVEDGDTVCVRHTASAGFGKKVNTTLTVGGVSDTFTSTTQAADTRPDAFRFTDANNVAPNSVQTSNPVTITGIQVPAPMFVEGGTFSIGCTGVFTQGSPITPTFVKNNQTVCVRHQASKQFGKTVNTKLTVGGVSDTFTSTTPPALTTPRDFSFTGVSEVPRSSVQTSDAVTVAGINAAATISVINGTYSIGCGPSESYTASAGIVFNDNKVCLRHMASPEPKTAVTTTLSIGGVKGSFTSVTTLGDSAIQAAPATLVKLAFGSGVVLRPTATLRDRDTGAPLVPPIGGYTVSFTAGATPLCTAVTDANGVATCQANIPSALQPELTRGGYTASFAGDARFKPSSGKGTVKAAR